MEQRNHAFADTLLVMEAPGGEIESFDILCLQGKTSEEVDKLLSRSLNRFCTVADGGDYVPDNRLKVKEVDVYKRQNQECYVRSGLSEGDRVLNQNVLLVYNSLNAD